MGTKAVKERKDYTVNQRYSFYGQGNEEMERNINKINHGHQSCGRMDNECISEQKEWMKECETGKKRDPK